MATAKHRTPELAKAHEPNLDQLFDEVARAAKEARDAQARHAAALDALERAMLLRNLLTA